MTLPEGRCSHFATVWREGVIIGGGMNSEMLPLGSCMYLSHAVQWNLTILEFTPSLPNKWVNIEKLFLVLHNCMSPVHILHRAECSYLCRILKVAQCWWALSFLSMNMHILSSIWPTWLGCRDTNFIGNYDCNDYSFPRCVTSSGLWSAYLFVSHI